MHMHTKKRPFACTYEGCTKSFCDRGALIQHENTHRSKNLKSYSHEFYNQTITKPVQSHSHHHEEHEKTIASVTEVRPIRLRLSQPKRQGPESLEESPRKSVLLRLHMKERPSNVSSDAGSTSEASSKYQVSGHGSKITSTTVPCITKPNVGPQAPASKHIVDLSSTEDNIDRPYTNGQTSMHGNSVYTRVCGIYSRERASPTKIKTKGGPYHCPRCDTQFTRALGVMRHFIGCITKYGNPESLKWTDHASLQGIVSFYARNGRQSQEHGPLSQEQNVLRDKQNSRKDLRDALFRSDVPVTSSRNVEKDKGNAEPVHKRPGRDALLVENVVRPMHKRRDALRRSEYNPKTIARDVLIATGDHPNMDPLNAHLDVLRRRFKAVDVDSDMSTFRWDLVDPEQEPDRQAGQDVEPEESAPKPSRTKRNPRKCVSSHKERYNELPPSLPSRSSTKQDALHQIAPFEVLLAEKLTHFGPMSTIFSKVFDRDPSAKIMSSDEDLWAAIFTMLETLYHGKKSVIRAAFSKRTGDVIGWIACQEANTFEAGAMNPSVYLDWMTAAHLLPSQTSRFTATKEGAEKKTKRSKQRKLGQGLASTIQAQATEAQDYLVPVPRLVINALVVHPLHQGRGVASALLKSVTEIADMEKKPIWIQTPEDPAVAQGALKAGLFRRAGFTCAGELNLDLDSFASGPRKRYEEKGVTLGLYKWNYMLRWPLPIRPKIITAAVK